jgi:hypothetical protein
MATIKGKWVFNDLIRGKSISQDVIFSFNTLEGSYNGHKIRFGYSDTTFRYELYFEYGTNQTLITYYGDTGEWASPLYKTIDFGTIDRNVSDEFLEWMQTNATQQTEPAPTDAVTIEYNGAVIASLKAGQSATLECKDLPMLDNVVVTVPEGMGGEDVPEWDGSIEVV